MNLLISSKQNLFKVKLHSEIYNENLADGFEHLQKEAEIKDAENRIKELKRLKSEIQWKEKRDRKQKEIEDRKADEKEYREYAEYLRRMAIGVIEESLKDDKEFKLKQNLNKLKENRIQKLRTQLLSKMELLDDFKKTLEDRQWNQLIDKEKKEERHKIHQEFIEKLQEEKVFKQLLYAAEKRVEQMERKKAREDMLIEKQRKLADQQRELEEELMMLKAMGQF